MRRKARFRVGQKVVIVRLEGIVQKVTRHTCEVGVLLSSNNVICYKDEIRPLTRREAQHG